MAARFSALFGMLMFLVASALLLTGCNTRDHGTKSLYKAVACKQAGTC